VTGERTLQETELFPCQLEVVALGRRIEITARNADSLEDLWINLGMKEDGTSNELNGVQSLRILLNGTDIREFRLRTYRSLLAIVQQDSFLFDGTVRDNIAYGRQDAADADVEDAALRANAHEFIEKLPEGYETLVGERGVKLSGGQQQRLAIARALLAAPQILILDEATSNLDTESEQLIQASMAALLAGRTTFVIAHRLGTIRDADVIMVVDGGRIVEAGNHAQLMAKKGIYERMYTSQLGEIG
jgi:ATP-binding cassette subfamily B protein/subfamily B ATP-binding cassette protein MsbA